MSLRWRCIGQYFDSSDIGVVGVNFTNQSDTPYALCCNGLYNSLKTEGDRVYFHLGIVNSGKSTIDYQLDPGKMVDDPHPVSITFNARMYNYICKAKTVEFFPGVFIAFEDINTVLRPCFVPDSNYDTTDIVPFPENILNGEWFTFEALWVDDILSVYVDGVCVIKKTSPNILTTGVKSILAYDENFEIGFDISDLQINRMYQYEHKPLVTASKNIVDGRVYLTIGTNLQDAEESDEPTKGDYAVVISAESSHTETVVTFKCLFEKLVYGQTVSYHSDNQGNYADVIMLDADNNEYNVHLEGYCVDDNGNRYCPATSSYQQAGNTYPQNVSEIFLTGYALSRRFAGNFHITSYIVMHFETPIYRSDLAPFCPVCGYNKSRDPVSAYIYNWDDFIASSSPSYSYTNIENELTIFNDVVDEYTSKNDFDHIRLEFANLTPYQRIDTQNIEFDNCTLLNEVENATGMYAVKTFQDDISSQTFDVHLYADPCYTHSLTIANGYNYDYYHHTNTTLNIVFPVKTNGVDLSGRHFHLYQGIDIIKCFPVTFNVYHNDTLKGSVDRKFSDIDFIIPSGAKKVSPAYAPVVTPNYIKHNIKLVFSGSEYEFTFYTPTLQIQNCSFVRVKSSTKDEAYLVYHNDMLNKDFDVHVYGTQINRWGSVNNISDEYRALIISPGDTSAGRATVDLCIEFTSECLENCIVSCDSCPDTHGFGQMSGVLYQFYFDGSVRKSIVLPNGSSTQTATIPLV